MKINVMNSFDRLPFEKMAIYFFYYCLWQLGSLVVKCFAPRSLGCRFKTLARSSKFCLYTKAPGLVIIGDRDSS